MSGALAGSRRRLPPAPVDSGPGGRQIVGVNRKPTKVEETATPYAAKQPAKPEAASAADKDGQVRYIAPETARKLTEKIFKEHDELFRKLAQ